MAVSLRASDSRRPLYRQLVEQLRAEVAKRAVGDKIDSEPKLAQRFGVSRFTVARAVEILVEEGLVRRRQGLGSFVAPAALVRAPSYLSSFTETVEAQGRRASHRLLNLGPAEWREGLSYPEDAKLIVMERLRFVDGAPAAIHRSFVDKKVADRIGLMRSVAAAPGFSLYRHFDRKGFILVRGVETLRARAATADEARLLAIADAPVVMAVRRETFGKDGALLDVVGAVYDARRYSCQAEITCDRAAATSSHSRKKVESNHASNSNVRRAFGPRLGPWGDHDGGSG